MNFLVFFRYFPIVSVTESTDIKYYLTFSAKSHEYSYHLFRKLTTHSSEINELTDTHLNIHWSF